MCIIVLCKNSPRDRCNAHNAYSRVRRARFTISVLEMCVHADRTPYRMAVLVLGLAVRNPSPRRVCRRHASRSVRFSPFTNPFDAYGRKRSPEILSSAIENWLCYRRVESDVHCACRNRLFIYLAHAPSVSERPTRRFSLTGCRCERIGGRPTLSERISPFGGVPGVCRMTFQEIRNV